MSLIDKILSQDFIDHTPLPGLSPTRDGVKMLFTAMHTAFPDLRVTICEQIAEEDKVATRKRFTGTHEGEFLGAPASGRPLDFEVIDILTVVEGQITEHRVVLNQLQLMQQLGAIPS